MFEDINETEGAKIFEHLRSKVPLLGRSHPTVYLAESRCGVNNNIIVSRHPVLDTCRAARNTGQDLFRAVQPGHKRAARPGGCVFINVPAAVVSHEEIARCVKCQPQGII